MFEYWAIGWRRLSQGSSVIVAFLIGLLILWYGFWLARPINFVLADLGRHLTNGRLLLAGGNMWRDIIGSNFYSYTATDWPVINHHWGTGVIFYAMEKLGGFIGVHGLFIGVSLGSLLLFFAAAWKLTRFEIAWLVTVVLVPLIAARLEVRPEGFSYLLFGLFYVLLVWHRSGSLSPKWLLLLPLFEIGWVNLHIYFIFGVYVVGLFLLESLVADVKLWLQHKQGRVGARSRWLALVLLLTIAATLISPFGLAGLTYPFTIFGNYGYTIVENKSILWLENWGMEQERFLMVKLLTGVAIVLVVAGLIRRRSASLADILLLATWLVMGWLAIRNFTVLGLLSIPVLASMLYKLLGDIDFRLDAAQRQGAWILLGAVTVVGTYFMAFDSINIQRQVLGFGLRPRVNETAEFIRQSGLAGPIFNNYDNGGYLIYQLYPESRVFVDNRPEAYPVSFFEDVYIPMQLDDEVWAAQLEEHKFNLIVFSHLDLTNWGQEFLAKRLQDREWLLVHRDPYQLVFARNTPANKKLLGK